MAIFLFILQWLIVIVLLVVLILMFLWMANLMRRGAPFVPISRSVLKHIDDVIEIHDDSTVYDLGCGDARVLLYLSNLHPGIKFIGVERSWFPYILANINIFFSNKNIRDNTKIIKKDFNDIDLSNATHVFCYLKPEVIDNLLSKLEKELKSGTRFISAYFRFTLKRPISEKVFAKNKNDVRKKLFIYKF